MKKIKLLYVLEAVGGGTQKAFYEQLISVDRKLFDITIVLPLPIITQTTRTGELNNPNFGSELQNLGFEVIYIRMYGSGWRLFLNVIGIYQLYLLNRKRKFNIVHGHSSVAGFVTRISCCFFGSSIGVYSPEGFAFSDHISPLKKYFYIFMERFAAKFGKSIVACSAAEKSLALKYSIEQYKRIEIIENPLDLSQYAVDGASIKNLKLEFTRERHNKLVGMVSRLVPQKNPIDFIKVASLISKKRHDIDFLVVGDGRMREELQMEIDKANLRPRIRLLGSRADYKELLSCMDILVLTSLWEGLPYTPVEAILLGTPVVMNEVTGSEDIVGDFDNEFLCEPGNIEQMAFKILQILDSAESTLSKVSKMGSQLRGRFDVKVTSLKLQRLYMGLVNEFS